MPILNNLLKPYLKINLLKKYNFSNKLMIPLLIPSLILHKYDSNKYH